MAGEPSFSVSNLHPADRILLGASLLLVIDSFLPWQKSAGLSLNAWSGTASWTGLLMGLCAIVLVLWSAAGAAGITAGAGETGERVGAVLVGATFGFGLLKFMLTGFNHGYLFAWTGLLCVLAIAYGGYMRLQEPKAAPEARAPGRPTPDRPVPPKKPPPPPGTGGFLP